MCGRDAVADTVADDDRSEAVRHRTRRRWPLTQPLVTAPAASRPASSVGQVGVGAAHAEGVEHQRFADVDGGRVLAEARATNEPGSTATIDVPINA